MTDSKRITEVHFWDSITFGDHTGWQRVLWISCEDAYHVFVHTLWHRARTVPSTTRVWTWR